MKYQSEQITGILTIPKLKEATNGITKLIQKHEFGEKLDFF